MIVLVLTILCSGVDHLLIVLVLPFCCASVDQLVIVLVLTTVNSACNDIVCNDIPDVTIQIGWSMSISIYSILLVYNDIPM